MMAETPLFGRAAEVTIDTLKLVGFDCRLEVSKTLKPEPNTCKLVVFNLNEDHRSQLEQLRDSIRATAIRKTDKSGKVTLLATKGIPVKIEAGYGTQLSLIWSGDLRTCNSIREGADWVTSLESGDAEKAWQNSRIQWSGGPGTPIVSALRNMITALGVGEGNLGTITPSLNMAGTRIYPSGVVLSGSTANNLTTFCKSCGLEWSIQDGSIQFLERGKALKGPALKVSSSTGMIGSPTVDDSGLLTIKTLILPGLRCGSLLVVDAARIKGNYRVEAARYSGDTGGGDWAITSICSRY